jgi:hypothetical protein
LDAPVSPCSAEPAPVAIALNGQDYTYDANALFTFYMAPTIFGLAPAGGPLVRYDIADTAHKVACHVLNQRLDAHLLIAPYTL